MKFTILALAAMAAAAPKWFASVLQHRHLRHPPRLQQHSILHTNGCHNFDAVNGVRSTAHLLYISANLRCDAFSEGDCAGTNFGNVNGAKGMNLDGTAGASSVNCIYSGH